MSICWEAAPSGARAQCLAQCFALFVAALVGSGSAAAQPLAQDELRRHTVASLVALAHNAQDASKCQNFQTILSELQDRYLVTRFPARGDESAARQAWDALYSEGCPRRRVAESPHSTIILGGGATWYDIPQIKGGTQFDPFAGREVPIAHSADVLTGGGGKLFATIPTNGSLWGDYFFIDASGSTFDGHGNGTVPIGGNNVAFTYIVPNPVSGSTGIFAGPTGQEVRINTDGHLIDVALGLKQVTPLPAPPGVQPFNLHTTAGFRYRNADTSHAINQQSLFFPDLNTQIGLDQNSHFFGAQFGVGLLTPPPGPEGGFVGGIHAFVAPGVLSTSSTARQTSHCGPCGIRSPEFDVSLRRAFDESRFSVIAGGSVHLGYQFNRSVGIFVKGRVEHMTDVPFFQVPTTPAEQPIFIDHGSSTNASVMGGFRVAFDTGAFETVP